MVYLFYFCLDALGTIFNQKVDKLGFFEEVFEHLGSILTFGPKKIDDDLGDCLVENVAVVIVLENLKNIVEDVLVYQSLVHVIFEATKH